MGDIVRIGIYGGTFDPFHEGHKQVIKNILDANLVDKIIIIPCKQNPLKHRKPSDSYKRVYKIEELTEEFGNKCEINTLEICKISNEPSYTYDTINNIMYKYWLRHDCVRYDYYLIIGVDEWNVFKQWKNYDWILKNVDVLVHPRPGIEPEWEHYRMKYFKDFEAKDISSTQIRLDNFIEGLKALNIGEDIRKIEFRKNVNGLIDKLKGES